ncbi:MAG: hypothetical protein NUW37_04635 [Planctomycetes bacterium]|nr:hypothetical protein [Planctomycetota bacterium]
MNEEYEHERSDEHGANSGDEQGANNAEGSQKEEKQLSGDKMREIVSLLEKLGMNTSTNHIAHLLSVSQATVSRWQMCLHVPHKSMQVRIDLLINILSKAAEGDKTALHVLAEIDYKNGNGWLRLGHRGYIIASQHEWALRFVRPAE